MSLRANMIIRYLYISSVLIRVQSQDVELFPLNPSITELVSFIVDYIID